MREDKGNRRLLFCMVGFIAVIFMMLNFKSVKADTKLNATFKELKVKENGVFINDNTICYDDSYNDSFDQKKGVLKVEQNKLTYFVDGKKQSNFSGRLTIADDGRATSFLIKNGVLDTNYNKPVQIICIYSGDEKPTIFNAVNGRYTGDSFGADYENKDDPAYGFRDRARNVAIKVETNGIRVSYNRNPYGDDRGFYIARLCKETGEYVKLATLDGESTGFLDTNVVKGYHYTYYIDTFSNYDMFGGSGYSCGFVDASIQFTQDAKGTVLSYKDNKKPETIKKTTYSLKDGVLTISGTGEMEDYSGTSNIPWYGEKDSIKEIIIEEGVTKVGRNAFCDCDKVEKVTIPSTVQWMNRGAFSGCTSLSNVTFAKDSQLKLICKAVFHKTENLKTITIPKSVVLFGRSSFLNSGIENFMVEPGGKYESKEGIIYTNEGKFLVLYPSGREDSSVSIPSGVTRVCSCAFINNSKISNVQLPEGLKEIQSDAFLGTGIKTLSVPKTVVEIVKGAVPENAIVTLEDGSKLLQEDGEYYCVSKAQITGDNNYNMAFQVLEQVNKERAAKGLTVLKMDKDLMNAAMERSAEISTYMNHTRPFGTSCFTVNKNACAENIAAGYMTAEKVMESWMNSAGHKSNILLKDAKGIGIGCVKINGAYYWVQLFQREDVSNEVNASDYSNRSNQYSVSFSDDNYGGEKLSLSANKTIIAPAETTKVELCFEDFNKVLLDNAVTYTSSNENVCTVDTKGNVKGVGEGEATIRAAFSNDKDLAREVTITVKKVVEPSTQKPVQPSTQKPVNPTTPAVKKIKVKKISISGISKQIASGKKIKLTAKVYPSNASYKKVSWKSSNKKVATVSSSGYVTFKKKTGGKYVTITATARDGSKVKAIYKIKSMKGIVKKVYVPSKKTIKAGKSAKVYVKVTASKGANKKLKWYSSNTKYATVTSSGKVKTKKAGKRRSVKITAKATDGSGKEDTITIKIK